MDKEKFFNELMENPTFKSWFDERPESIKALFRQYPFEVYRIRSGAPYAITSPGTIVHVRSFHESGEVSVAVIPENLRDDAKDHIKEIMTENNRLHLYEQALKSPVAVQLKPIYLEELEEDEYEQYISAHSKP